MQATLEQLRELGPELEVIRHLCDESFGSLFLAREAALRRVVVIKVLRAEYVDNEEARLRFEREARAAAGISHPNVIAVYGVGRLANGVPYFKEPYVGDTTLRERLKSVGRFQPAEVRKILHQLGCALEAAHASGIVHRDVRPETVRCEEHGDRVLLTDFGIAGILDSAGLDEDPITRSGEVLGSVGYMSPEQMNSLPLTDRSDIYALGVLGWRLLAGSKARVPAAGADMDRGEMLALAPDDAELIDLLARCLRPQPDDRPSAGQVVRALEPRAGGHPDSGAWHRDAIAELIERRIPYAVLLLLSTATIVLGISLEMTQISPRARWLAATFLAAVFLSALVVIWYHGKEGPQTITKKELVWLGAIATAWLAASVFVWGLLSPD